jgi:hypothetical protein
MVVQPFRLQKNLVAVPVLETLHLVFNGRTIARTSPFDRAGKQRRSVEVQPNNLMRPLVRPRNRARELGYANALVDCRHGPSAPVARLGLKTRPINGSSIKAWRRPCLEPTLCEADFPDLVPQDGRGSLATASPLTDFLPHENASIKEGACGDNQGATFDSTVAGAHPGHPTAIDRDGQRLRQQNLDAATQDEVPHRPAVQLPVCLDTRTLNCGALAPIKHPTVNRRTICCTSHEAIEYIEFANQVPFAHAAYRRIARHLSDVRRLERYQSHASTTSRCGGCRLATRVPRANNKNIEHR